VAPPAAVSALVTGEHLQHVSAWVISNTQQQKPLHQSLLYVSCHAGTPPANGLTRLSEFETAQPNEYSMKKIILPLSLITLAALASSAATFTVTTTADSGPGSLREAILGANASPGLDTIAFNISGTGIKTIKPTLPLPVIEDPVVIDGTTQPGYAGLPRIELNGKLAGAGVDGLTISAGGSTVRGLAVNRFNGSGLVLQDGGGNRIQRNHIGTGVNGTGSDIPNGNDGIHVLGSSDNLIGGSLPEHRNILSGNNWSGIRIENGASRNRVEGNYIGMDVTGTVRLRNDGRGITVDGASANIIGGLVPGARNVISGNGNSGIGLFGGASDNVIQGNLIGTDVAGIHAFANAHGIIISDAGTSGNLVGGSQPEGRNLISGNLYAGVRIEGQAADNLVQGNSIGPDIQGGKAIGNGRYGIEIAAGASYNLIGGAPAQAGNQIAFNKQGGVAVGAGVGNGILGNSIFENARLGIDLWPEGVNANDAGDTDTGPNNRQNFPILSAVILGSSTMTVTGSLNSRPGGSYLIQFFANAINDPTGYGEGEVFLGSTNVVTDGYGNAAFTVTFNRAPGGRDQVTATATDASNNTSEFSQALPTTLLLLKITEATSGQMTVSWPTNCDGFQLEWADRLPCTNWTPVAVAPEPANGLFRVLLSTTNRAAFFRLHQP
jgi:hypothetical protein